MLEPLLATRDRTRLDSVALDAASQVGQRGLAFEDVLAERAVPSGITLVDVPLRSSSLPRGVLITAIERGRDVIRPTGETIFHAGDRLIVLGGSDDLDLLGQLALSKHP